MKNIRSLVALLAITLTFVAGAASAQTAPLPDTRVGIFLVDDPPSERHIDNVRSAVAENDYPWERLMPALKARGRTSIPIRFEGNNLTENGSWDGGTIRVNPDTGDLLQQVILTHEMGHMVVDYAMSNPARDALRNALHTDIRTTEQTEPDGTVRPVHTADPRPGFHTETWGACTNWQACIGEAAADLFIAAFNPELKATAAAAVRTQHWTNDVFGSRSIWLSDAIPAYFPDVPTTHGQYADIMWLAANGITTGDANGNFNPSATLTRAQFAAFLHRYHLNVPE